MLRILDSVIEAIERAVAAVPPERGGAVLGPRGRPLLSHFVFDEWAPWAPDRYRPSPELAERVRALEAGLDLEFKGIVHSHPGGLDRPSAADREELAEGLRRNPHLSRYLALIVTAGPEGPTGLSPHELSLAGGKLGCFAAYRAPSGEVRITPVPARILPLRRDLERLRARLGGERPAEVFLTQLEGELWLAGRLVLPGGPELLFLFDEGYPLIPPVLLAVGEDGEPEAVALRWSLARPAEERLAAALEEFLWPPGPYRRAFGPPGGPAMTGDLDAARWAGWIAGWGGDPSPRAAALREGLARRLAGLKAPPLHRRVLIAGLGSVGSYMAEVLARSGIGGLTLIDPEAVEEANLSRTIYEATDVGRPKVEAAAGRLVRIRPDLQLHLIPQAVQALSAAELDRILREADLVIAATDDPEAQRRLNHWAYMRGKPALFVGLYAGARGGEVIITVPERTPCYLCATRIRHAGSAPEPAAMDYGTGRLTGEPALGADIQHVASAAAKLALALLADPDDPVAGILERPLREGMSYLTFAMVPDYWFYPRIFERTPGQHAFQSVWLTPIRDPECPVCGEPAGRVDPAEADGRSPRLARLREADDAASEPEQPEERGPFEFGGDPPARADPLP